MQTLAQKQNQPQKRASVGLVRSKTVASVPDYHGHPVLQLQRTVGNQAVQGMLQTRFDEFNAGLTSTASPRLGHDFGRIPVRPTGAGEIQTKLAVNESGDEYEQEADRIS